jgi:ATP-dependent protease ClpP protease subunit
MKADLEPSEGDPSKRRRLKSYPSSALSRRLAVNRLVEAPRNSSGTIYFDSCGGSAYVGLGLASLIRLRGLKPIGVVTGECSSAAILPFAACVRRFVTPHSTLLFHPLRWQSEESVKYEEAAEWARHFQDMERDLDELLSRMFQISIERLAAWTRPGHFVTGAEMVVVRRRLASNRAEKRPVRRHSQTLTPIRRRES